MALQTAATPNQGDIYSWVVQELETCGATTAFFNVPTPRLSFSVLGLRWLFLLSQSVCLPCPRLHVLWELVGLFQIQPRSITEVENSGVLWEAVCSDFKGIPDSSLRK